MSGFLLSASTTWVAASGSDWGITVTSNAMPALAYIALPVRSSVATTEGLLDTNAATRSHPDCLAYCASAAKLAASPPDRRNAWSFAHSEAVCGVLENQ